MLRSQWAKKESDVALMLRVKKCPFLQMLRAMLQMLRSGTNRAEILMLP